MIKLLLITSLLFLIFTLIGNLYDNIKLKKLFLRLDKMKREQ